MQVQYTCLPLTSAVDGDGDGDEDAGDNDDDVKRTELKIEKYLL